MLRVDRTAFFKNKSMCDNTTGTKEIITPEDLERLIEKVKDHKANVNQIVDSIFDSLYYLDKLKFSENSKHHHYIDSCNKNLFNIMKWLDEEDRKNYIDSIGPLFTLQNHIKERYEKEILNPNNTKSEA